MMQYDFVDSSTDIGCINGLETKENMHLYQTHSAQDSFLKSNSNMITTSDLWPSSSNSNSINQSFYFPSASSDLNPSQYHTIDHNNYDYQTLPDVSSSSYLIDPYSHMFTNNYSIDPYTTPTTYNTTSMDYSSSTYTDSYQHLHPMYTNTNVILPPVSSSSYMDIQPDYQSTSATSTQWDSSMIKMHSHDITSASNSSHGISTSTSKQPCLVCHEESSGYHFGAYTCESCKAFYRRVTKDPTIEIKHSCEVPLPNITKSNRKDCRACRKAKCDRVGMTAMPKDRPTRTTTTKNSSLPVTDLLEQLAHDLTYDQLSTSTAFQTLLRMMDLSTINPMNFDYHTVYMNALRIWRNQYNNNNSLQTIVNTILIDTFPILLFLFHTFITMTDNTNEDKSIQNSKFDKLVNILQQEIYRITGNDQRLASKIKALFMKCYVALAQYPNSTNHFDNNILSQTQFISYQQYPVYGQS